MRGCRHRFDRYHGGNGTGCCVMLFGFVTVLFFAARAIAKML